MFDIEKKELFNFLSEISYDFVRTCSKQERLQLLSKMLQSAWVLIPCDAPQWKCKGCKYKQFCDDLLKLSESAQELVKTNETL